MRKPSLARSPIGSDQQGRKGFQKHPVDKGNPHFERMGHAGPVGITQKLIAHIEGGFKRSHPRKGMARIGRQCPRDMGKWIKSGETLSGSTPHQAIQEAPRA